MTQPAPCPRCHSARLAVLYYDAEGRPVGGHLLCSECGARHAAGLSRPAERGGRRRDGLLERKAS